MSDKFHWDDTTSVSRDGVTVERELEGRDDGIIVTMDLRADVSGPLRVDVRDEFPADLPAEQAGFNVEYEPDEGDLSLERAEISHTIEDDSARIVYAIRLAEPAGAVEFDDPTIENVMLPGLSDPSPTDDEPAGAPEPATDDPAQESMAFDSSAFESTAGAERSAQTAADDPEGADGSGSSPATTDTAEVGPDAAGGQGADEGVNGSSAPGSSGAGSIEQAIAETERAEGEGPDVLGGRTGPGGDPSGDQVDPNDGTPAGRWADGPPANGRPTDVRPAGDGTTDGSGSEWSVAGDRGAGSSTEGSAGRASDAGPSDRDRDPTPDSDPAPGAAGTAGDPRTGSSEEVSRSVRLRLDRLSARVEEFATYAEALSDIIEREGTGPEILENLESDLADANERLDEVRANVDSLESAHSEDVSAVRDRIDSLEDELEAARSDLRSDLVEVRGTVDDVGADVERVDHEAAENAEEVEEVRTQIEDVESAVHSLDERVDGHEDDLEDVSEVVDAMQEEMSGFSESLEEMRSDVESLQVDVERLLRFREILSDVFGGAVQRATEDDGEPADLAGEDRSDDDGSISTPSEPSD